MLETQECKTNAYDRRQMAEAKHYNKVGVLALNNVSYCEKVMPHNKRNTCLFFLHYISPVDVQSVLQHHFSSRV